MISAHDNSPFNGWMDGWMAGFSLLMEMWETGAGISMPRCHVYLEILPSWKLADGMRHHNRSIDYYSSNRGISFRRVYDSFIDSCVCVCVCVCVALLPCGVVAPCLISIYKCEKKMNQWRGEYFPEKKEEEEEEEEGGKIRRKSSENAPRGQQENEGRKKRNRDEMPENEAREINACFDAVSYSDEATRMRPRHWLLFAPPADDWQCRNLAAAAGYFLLDDWFTHSNFDAFDSKIYK